MHNPNFRLKASKQFFLVLFAMHFFGVIGVFCAELPVYVQFIFTGLLGINFHLSLRRWISLNGQNSVVQLMLDDTGDWWLQLRNGKRVIAQQTAGTYRSSWLVVLIVVDRFSQDKYHLPVFPDSVTKDEFRNLQGYLTASNSLAPAVTGSLK